mgnify:CR=1 FL=1
MIPKARLGMLLALLAGQLALGSPRAAAHGGSADNLGGGLFVEGRHLFVAAWGYGLQILDITEPTSPRWTGAWNRRGAVNGVFVVGDHAYLANRVAGLEVLDVRDPQRPVSLAKLHTGGDAMAVLVQGDFAVLAEAKMANGHSVVPPPGEGLTLVDVANRSAPRLLGRYVGPNGDYGLPGGAEIPDVARLGRVVHENRGPLGAASAWHSAHRIVGWGMAGFHVVGDRLYSTSGRAGLRIYDVREPLGPVLLGELRTDFATYDVRVAGDFAYLMDAGADIHVVAVSNPQAPRVVGAFPSTGYTSRVLGLEPLPLAATTRPESASPGGPGGFGVLPVETAPPELRDPQRRTDGSFAFRLVGVPFATYVIQVTTDWQTWQNLGTNNLPANGHVLIEDASAVGVAERFYRAVRQPTPGN